MHTDSYTKVVLSLILLCLVLLAAQGFLTQVGRYEVEVVKMARRQAILRHDTATGQIWRMKNFASDDARWVALGDEPAEAGAEAAPEEPGDPTAISGALDEPREISDLETILGSLQSHKPQMRVWAVAQLSHGHFPAVIAVPPLIPLLDAEEPSVVIAAVEGLARMKDPGALPALRKLLSRPDAEVVASAEKAIAEIESGG